MSGYREMSVTAAVCLFAVLSIGCSIPRPSTPLALGNLERAVLVTKGIRIEVIEPEGSMPAEILPDQPFTPGRFFPHVPVPSAVEAADHEQYQNNGYFGVESLERFGVSRAFRVRYFVFVQRVHPGSPADQAGWGAREDPIYIRSLGGSQVTETEHVWQHFGWEANPRPGTSIAYEACTLSGACTTGTIQAEPLPPIYQVRVHVDGLDEPLHGLLAFFPVDATAEGSARRIYRMDVPRGYIERASGGNVSVVYQPYNATVVDAFGASSTVTYVAWALWLSDVPFY
jgi:hypothetical protein